MQQHLRAMWPVLAIAAAATIPAGFAHAAGFALIEQSASGMGTAFAGAGSSAQDASTVFFNPAGMSMLEGNHYAVDAHYVVLHGQFSNGDSRSMLGTPLTGEDFGGGRIAIIPNAYLVTGLTNRWTFGLGINAPFGLSSKYSPTWVGRYHAIDSEATSVNINPSFAFRASDSLSVGFGASAQYFDVKLSSAVDFGTLCQLQESPIGSTFPAGTCSAAGLSSQQADGYAKVSGNDWGYGWNVGLLYDLSPATRVGLAYRSEVHHNLKGKVDFTVPSAASFMTSGGLFTDQAAQASVDLPDSLTTSIHHSVNDRLNVMADVALTRWSVFKELRVEYPDTSQPDSVTTENWKDSWRVAVGSDYRYGEKLTLRGGLAYEQGPVPDAEHRTPRIPDGNRTWVAVGLGYQFSKSTAVDFGYAHLFIPDLAVNTTTEGALNQTLNGSFKASADIVSVQLRGSF